MRVYASRNAIYFFFNRCANQYSTVLQSSIVGQAVGVCITPPKQRTCLKVRLFHHAFIKYVPPTLAKLELQGVRSFSVFYAGIPININGQRQSIFHDFSSPIASHICTTVCNIPWSTIFQLDLESSIYSTDSTAY